MVNLKKIKNPFDGDFLLFLLVLALTGFGIIMVASASSYSALSTSETGSPYGYLKKDVVYAAAGLILMALFARMDYHILRKCSKVILVVSIVLLIFVLTPAGRSAGGAQRWIDLGFMNLMPGEWAKLAAIIFASYYLSRDPERARSFLKGFLPMLLLAGIYLVLIASQPNASTALIVAIIIMGVYFIAGMRWWIAGVAAGVLVGAGAFLMLSNAAGYRYKRFLVFLDPFADAQGKGYQVCQSLLALGSGGLKGLGLGNSIQKTLYLPEPQNDFILAIIGEELGFIGVALLLIAYILLIWRCVNTALRAPDQFGMLLCSGITMFIGIQVAMNVAVVTSSMPCTGVALPFISWGGNALLMCLVCMGIVLNISRQAVKGTDL